MTVKTRFAPSPTGELHIGGVRTALFSYLFAKHAEGKFLLRIEDTDVERSTQTSVDGILAGMAWLGLDYVGPEYQSKRFERYQSVANELLERGLAYRCYCSKERIEKLRESQLAKKEKPRYDNHCRDLKDGDPSQPHVIRFKNPLTGTVTFHDSVHGDVTVENSELDDLVLLRSDGVPTYNFSVVIDDMDMQVSHVIRGDDHINNTPRQINIYEAINGTPPQYCHVPMILGTDGKRLSKRHGASSVLAYRDEGYLPEALLNFLVRLGWSHGDQEIFSLAEMIDLFDVDHISKSAASFSREKLDWINQHYLKTLPIETILPHLKVQIDKDNVDAKGDIDWETFVRTYADRVPTLKAMLEEAAYLFENDVQFDEEAKAAHLTEESQPIIAYVAERLDALSDWKVETIKPLIKETVKHFGVKFPKVAQPLRVALTGTTHSPSIDVTAYLIGKERCLERLQACG